jgi:hypothetical protein
MSLTKIYDQLVNEFKEAGMYYGGAMELPEKVALSAYDDTTVFQAVQVSDEPVKPSQDLSETVIMDAPKTIAAIMSLVDRIREIQANETSDTLVLRAPKQDTISDAIRTVKAAELDSVTALTLAFAVPEQTEEEVQHVFPIRKQIHHFDFFGSRHQAMHAA